MHDAKQLRGVFDVVFVRDADVIRAGEPKASRWHRRLRLCRLKLLRWRRRLKLCRLKLFRWLQPVLTEGLLRCFRAVVRQSDAPTVLRQLLQIQIVAFAGAQNQKRRPRGGFADDIVRQFGSVSGPVVEFVVT